MAISDIQSMPCVGKKVWMLLVLIDEGSKTEMSTSSIKGYPSLIMLEKKGKMENNTIGSI